MSAAIRNHTPASEGHTVQVDCQEIDVVPVVAGEFARLVRRG